jgi:hypothetical protein
MEMFYDVENEDEFTPDLLMSGGQQGFIRPGTGPPQLF